MLEARLEMDAGLLRCRVMALQLLAHIEPGEARELRRRSGRIIAELEHADLERHIRSGRWRASRD